MPPKGIDQNWLNIYTMLANDPKRAADVLRDMRERQHQSPALKKTIERIIPLEHPETHETLLDRTALQPLPEHMKHLFALGVNPNQQDPNGNTTLIKVVQLDKGTGEYMPIIRLLVAHGADPHKANNEEQTAWGIAQTYHRPRRYNTVLHFQTIAYGSDSPFALNETATLPLEFVARYLDSELERRKLRCVNKELYTAIPDPRQQIEWQIFCERNPVIRHGRQKISWQTEYEEESKRNSEKVAQVQ